MNEVKSSTGISASGGSLGQTLKTRRLQRGVSLEQASQKTRVHIRFLRAMEEERWQEFPAAVYRQGFLKLYGNYLGLDGEKLLDELKTMNVVEERPEDVVPGLYKRQPAEAHAQEEMREETPPSYGKVALGVGILAVAALSYVFLTQKQAPARAPQPMTAPLTQAPAPEPSAPVSASHTFKINVKKNVWVRVWADDRVRMEGIVQTGVTKDFPSKDNFRLEFGNAPALEVLMDGQVIQPSRVSSTGSGEYSWPARAPRPRVQAAPSPSATPGAAAAPPAAPAWLQPAGSLSTSGTGRPLPHNSGDSSQP